MGDFFEPQLVKSSRCAEYVNKPVEKQSTPEVQSFFQSRSAGINKKKSINLQVVDNPILYEDPSPEIYILTSYFSETLNQGLWRFIKTTLGRRIRVIHVFTHDLKLLADDTELIKSMTIDLKKYVPDYSVVITVGFPSLTALTRSTDFYIDHFYDYKYSNTWFFTPWIKSWVFPVDTVGSLWNEKQGRTIDNFAGHFLAKQCVKVREFKRPTRLPPDPIIVVIDNPDKFLLQHMEPCKVAWDLETSGFRHRDDRVVCLTMSFDGITGYFLPWSRVIPAMFNDFLKNKFQIGANLKFDCKFMHFLGVTNAKIDFDTWHAGHVLNEMRSNSLKTHAFLFTPWGGYDDGLEEYKKRYKDASKDYSKIPFSILIPYATMDAIVCYRTFEAMDAQLRNDTLAVETGCPTLAEYYYNEVIPSINLYLKSEIRGLDIDWERCREVEKLMLPMIDEARESAIQALKDALIIIGCDELNADHEVRNFNIDSPSELGLFIRDYLNWPAPDKLTASGLYTTGKVPMQEWKKLGYSQAGALLEYSQIKATYRSFVGNELAKTGMWKYKTTGGRIYPMFSVMMAKSGRNKSSGPNFQNFPKHSKYSELIRSMFKAPKGYLFGETDGAGLQLRIGASQSNDVVMREAFLNGGGDLHSLTGLTVFCKTYPVYDVDVGDYRVCSINPVTVVRYGVKEKIPLFKVRSDDQIVTLALDDRMEIDVDIAGSTIQGELKHPALSFMTIEQFKYWCKVGYVKGLRSKAKGLNFSNLFGGTPMGLGLGILHQVWNEADCDAFIEENGLQDKVRRWIKGDVSGSQAKFIACAEKIIDVFFTLYYGLKEWQDSNIARAMVQGCIRSPFGARRLLPELLYTEGREIDNRRHIKNLMNITANSPVQNHEVVVIHRAMRAINNYIVENQLKSEIIGNVHDASVGYYKTTELNAGLLNVIHAAFSVDHKENNGIPYTCETNFADPAKDQGWGFGREVSADDIDDDYFEVEDDLEN
jgi:DNA polymerase I-like protein with 3'-5' exonuclease and polymerase domains